MRSFQTESKRVLDLMINSIYTNKEIFLRELISNCSDALDKLYFNASKDKVTGLSRTDYFINIEIDKDNRKLIVKDNGIGMTEAELESNLGTIAKSGSLAFKEQNKMDDMNIIGQFGVGFYSSFMVADKIEVTSKAYGSSEAFKWISSGVEGYEIEKADKQDAGTEIVLYLKADTEDENYDIYLQEYKIKELIKKYSDYISYPIKMQVTKHKMAENEGEEAEEYKEEETLNSMTPLWKTQKSSITAEQYDSFYKDNFHDYEKPLKVIHTEAEGVVDYKALLFIPATAPFNYYTKNYEKGLKLYTNGVIIMDMCKELLGDHFSFVKGIVDSELTLNISRETIQQSRQLKLISSNLEKKIKKELLSMQKDERDNYEKFFKAFGMQLKYGIYQSYGMNKELLQDLLIFSSTTQDKMVTLSEYVENMQADQQFIYYQAGKTKDAILALPQVAKVKSKGYDVLCFTDDVDEFAIKMMGTYKEKAFKNIESEDLGLTEDTNTNQDDKEMLDFIKDELIGKVAKVKASSLLDKHPVCLSSEGEVSIEMEKVLNAMPNADGSMKAVKVLELNTNHAIYEKLKDLYQSDKDRLKEVVKVIYAQGLLISGLPIDNPTELASLTLELLSK